MINVAELITDRDFCQPNGISISRYVDAVVDHKVSQTESNIVVQGIIIELEPNEDEMLPEYDRNKETITILTRERLKTVGVDKLTGVSYGADIVHHNGNDYIVRTCQDLSQYGYCRSKAVKLEQDEM